MSRPALNQLQQVIWSPLIRFLPSKNARRDYFLCFLIDKWPGMTFNHIKLLSFINCARLHQLLDFSQHSTGTYQCVAQNYWGAIAGPFFHASLKDDADEVRSNRYNYRPGPFGQGSGQGPFSVLAVAGRKVLCFLKMFLK